MSRTVQELGLELLGLPAQSRAYLAARLLDSLEEAEDENREQIWIEEVRRRLRDVHEGKASLRPIDEVLRELKSRHQ